MAEDIVLRLRAENEELLRRLEESQEEVRSLRSEVDKLGASGTGAGDEIDQAFAGMREDFASAKADLDRLEQSTKNFEASTHDAAAGYTSLSDEILSITPKVASAILSIQAAVQTLRESFVATRGAIDFLKEFNIDVDDLVQRLPALQQFVDDVTNFDRLFKDEDAAAAKDLANQINILTKNGVEFIPTAEGVAAAMAKWSESQRQLGERTQESTGALQKLEEQVAGLTVEDATQEIRDLVAIVRELGGNVDELLKGPLGERFADRFDKAKEAARLLGLEISDVVDEEDAGQFDRIGKAVDGYRAQVKATREATEAAKETQVEYTEAVGKGTAEAVDLAKEKLAELEEQFRQSTDRLDELTKKALAPVERKPTPAPQPTPGGDDDATKRVQEIRRELDALDAQQREGFLVTEDALQRQASLQNDLLEAESDLSRQAERTGQVFFQSGQRAAEGQQKLNDLIQGAREEVKALADQLGEGSSSGVDAINRQIDAFDGFSQTVGATGIDVALFTQGVKDSLEKLKRDAEASFGETAKGADQSKEAVEGLGDAAKDAAKSADELGKTTKTAAEHAKELGDVNIERLPDSLEEADAIAQKHLATLDQIIAKWVEINALVGGV